MTSHLLDNVGTLAAFALQPSTLDRQHLIVEAYSLLALRALRRGEESNLANVPGVSNLQPILLTDYLGISSPHHHG